MSINCYGVLEIKQQTIDLFINKSIFIQVFKAKAKEQYIISHMYFVYHQAYAYVTSYNLFKLVKGLQLLVVIFVHKYIDLLKLYFVLVIKHNTKFKINKVYIFSDVFFDWFDIYFISNTCHYTYFQLIFFLAFNTFKDPPVNISILKKKTGVYTSNLFHFSINTLNISKTSSYI